MCSIVSLRCRYYGQRICGQRFVDYSRGVFRYVFMSKNPIVMIIYIMIAYGGMIIFMSRGVFQYLPNEDIGLPHLVICCGLMMSSLSSFLFLLRTDPGRVTRQRIPVLLSQYKYDGVLYQQGECRSCKATKIARSKHCSLCGMCVEKQDHHCIWINGCVGAHNYRFFLWFLASHSIMCSDIAFITTFVYMAIIREGNLLHANYV